MPTKKGKNTKKKGLRLSSDDDENLPPLDVQYNPEVIDGLLSDLNQQCEIKCSQLQKDTDFMVASIQQAFHLELIKLPNQVKNMSLARFKEEFGESLEAVTRGVIGGPLSNRAIPKPLTLQQKPTISSNVFNTATKSTRPTSRIFQTPSAGGKFANQPFNNIRNPKEGEKILSLNGSPLGDFKTVVKAPKHNNTFIKVPSTPNVFIPLDSGDVLDIENIDIEKLSDDHKEDALMKMKTMMNNIQMCMNKLENSKK